MSLLRKYTFADRQLHRMAEELYQMLTATFGGLRWNDNIAPLITFRYVGTSAPIDVLTKSATVPLAVLCLRAVKRSDQSTTESGARVTWSQNGTTLRVHAIDLTSGSDEYDVHLGVLNG